MSSNLFLSVIVYHDFIYFDDGFLKYVCLTMIDLVPPNKIVYSTWQSDPASISYPMSWVILNNYNTDK